MMQMSMFEVAQYDDLCAANVEKVHAITGGEAEKGVALGFLAVERRLEMVVSILKGLRLLPPEFEYLYEMELSKELDELIEQQAYGA